MFVQVYKNLDTLCCRKQGSTYLLMLDYLTSDDLIKLFDFLKELGVNVEYCVKEVERHGGKKDGSKKRSQGV